MEKTLLLSTVWMMNQHKACFAYHTCMQCIHTNRYNTTCWEKLFGKKFVCIVVVRLEFKTKWMQLICLFVLLFLLKSNLLLVWFFYETALFWISSMCACDREIGLEAGMLNAVQKEINAKVIWEKNHLAMLFWNRETYASISIYPSKK